MTPEMEAELARLGVIPPRRPEPPRPVFAPGWKPKYPGEECPF